MLENSMNTIERCKKRSLKCTGFENEASHCNSNDENKHDYHPLLKRSRKHSPSMNDNGKRKEKHSIHKHRNKDLRKDNSHNLDDIPHKIEKEIYSINKSNNKTNRKRKIEPKSEITLDTNSKKYPNKEERRNFQRLLETLIREEKQEQRTIIKSNSKTLTKISNDKFEFDCDRDYGPTLSISDERITFGEWIY